VCIENDDLKKRLQEYDNGMKKLKGESENKIAILSQECQRLNALAEKRA